MSDMVSSKQQGFTLIEITLVLAITGGLLVLAFAGQSVIRSKSEFTDAVESVTTNINQVKNEARLTVQTEASNNSTPGATIGTTFFAKLMEFNLNSSSYTVFDAYANLSNNTFSPLSNQTTYQIPWGAEITGISINNTSCTPGPCYLIFHPATLTSNLLTYTYATIPSPLVPSSFNESPVGNSNIGVLTLTLTSANGSHATITVNGPSAGAVTRAF